MDWNLEYGELSKDKDFVGKCEDLKESMMELQKTLDKLLPLKQNYDKLDLHSRIDLDLFLAFTLNSLHWVNLRINGIDPMTHPIKDELERIKNAMKRWSQVREKDRRPIVDIEAAKRFVRSGLYDPNQGLNPPKNKKIKFED